MRLEIPGQKEKIIWTQHSRAKMRQYRFSEKRVIKIFRKPSRLEEGIASYTIAAMQPSGTKKNPSEVWVMYQKLKKPKAVRIISAWRYPGKTPIGERPIIPIDTLEELNKKIK